MATQLNLKRVQGLHYNEETKALHLRLDEHDTISEVVDLVKSGVLKECEYLHLTVTDGLFLPEQTDQSLLLKMCGTISVSLRHLKEIHIGRALSGFMLTNAGAWCPVEAIQVLLENCAHLQCLMLRNLQVYSTRQGSKAVHPGHLLAQSLSGHASLQCFGWQHNEFVPRGTTTLDPMLHSLSTIPNLKNMTVQSPPWAVIRVPTEHQVLKTLVAPTLRSLHLDGLQLQDNHIRSLLETPASQTSLQSLSLSIQLTLANIQDVGVCLANFLQQGGSSLLHLGLRLEWLVEDARVVTSPTFRKKRLQELQDFQNTIALAINGDSCLQRLDLIYYDSSHRWSECANTTSSKDVFRELLQTNYTLTHLRLPFCGEMDPMIDFLLKVNRTGLRQKLLQGNPTRVDCLDALAEMQQTSNSCVPEALAKTGFSVLFHMLREMPTLFP